MDFKTLGEKKKKKQGMKKYVQYSILLSFFILDVPSKVEKDTQKWKAYVQDKNKKW